MYIVVVTSTSTSSLCGLFYLAFLCLVVYASPRHVSPAVPSQAEYWREQLRGKGEEWVDYGNDVEGTAFADCGNDPLSNSAWNLNVSIRAPGYG